MIRTQKILCCQKCFAVRSPDELHKPCDGYARPGTYEGYADRASLIGSGELDDDEVAVERKSMKRNVKKNPVSSSDEQAGAD